MRFNVVHFLSTLGLSAVVGASPLGAQTKSAAWEAGMVLDTAATSQALALGARDAGLGLGHSDVLVRGTVGALFSAEAIVGFHTADRKLEHHLENAWLQTRALPQGFQARLGRFASQVGYLNELHTHTDDFTERPLLYRGFFGGHWLGDCLRMNWTAPTPFYLRLGAEKFSSSSTLNLKVGNDWGPSHSWQWGVSQITNGKDTEVVDHDAAEGHHSHAAQYIGRRVWLTDFVWKWAPNGNNRNEQVRLVWEHAQVSRLHPNADAGMKNQSSSLGAVWRFRPAWEVGARSDWLRANQAESSGGSVLFASGRLQENALMLAYKPSHQQTWRLQWTQQRALGANDEGEPIFASPAKRSFQLQYVIGLGAHGAHSY